MAKTALNPIPMRPKINPTKPPVVAEVGKAPCSNFEMSIVLQGGPIKWGDSDAPDACPYCNRAGHIVGVKDDHGPFNGQPYAKLKCTKVCNKCGAGLA